ncbi:hypothetical protein BDQ17DRAFT_1424784 [Cyathus striatus]|nr:hypothetical protein BDQ17DRAFT_1424784 [Cyathus striatus]
MYLDMDVIPKIKDVYFQVQWNNEQYQEGMKQLEGVFDEYYRPLESADSAMSGSAEAKNIASLSKTVPRIYGSSFLLHAVQSYQWVEKVSSNP